MCLSIPGKIIKIEKDIATIDYDGEIRMATTALKTESKVGDYVLVSQKIIMEIIPESEAKKIIELWDNAESK